MRIEVTTAEAKLLVAAVRQASYNYPDLDDLAWHIQLQVEHHVDRGDWPSDLELHWVSRQDFLAAVYDALVGAGYDDLADVLEVEFT